MIRLDFSGTTKELIGNRGIANQDIDAILPLVKKAHETIRKKRSSKEILFYDLPYMKDMASEVKKAAKEFLEKDFKDIVHLGIGGSSLGPKTIFSALKGYFHNYIASPRMFFLENIDPETITSLLDMIDPKETLFTVVSKSGTTAETASQFMIAVDLLKKKLGKKYKDHLIFITDPKRGVLRSLASKEGIKTLSIPPEIGGRFSVLTPVGLFPAALCKINIEKLLSGAAKMADICVLPDVYKNPAYMYAIIHFLSLAKSMNISVLMPYVDSLYDLADWYRQLWAESIGKRVSLNGKELFTGQTPVKALGATDQHSQVQLYMEGPFDKIITIITVNKYRNDISIPRIGIDELNYLEKKKMSDLINAEATATRAALIKNKRPTIHIELDRVNEEALGGLFMFFEAATAFMGYLLQINPFDQPGVELGKQLTFSLMKRPGFENEKEIMKDSLQTLDHMRIEI